MAPPPRAALRLAPVGGRRTQEHAGRPGEGSREGLWEGTKGATTSGPWPRLKSKDNYKSQHRPRPRSPVPDELQLPLLEHPENLAWIDLSFNDLTCIDPILTTFFNLSVLYLHGNSIQHLGEVNKLAVLPRLRSLTLHGNPIEEEKGYRQYVLCTLPRITTFDFSGVTKADRTTAEVWKRMNIKPKKVRVKHNVS
ncbi:leucine-rich repeat-containing protein 51 isoform X1 [Vicugna pacos]|uniref:Leucine-rich repeat-containing protein 51 n=1 Tax=Vicugna pacos TaxID=30538 RepID=A0ABM5DWZ0_VICPA